MTQFNPYAAPETDSLTPVISESLGEGVWRDRKTLVMLKTAKLPDACVVCNAPAEGYTLRRKLYWHASWWYLLALFNLLFYLIAALLIRKTADIRIGLCPHHRSRRRTWIIVAWLLAAVGLIFPVLLGMLSADAAVLGITLLPVCLLSAVLVGIFGTRVVRARRIDADYAWIAGPGPAFLGSLPPWKSPS